MLEEGDIVQSELFAFGVRDKYDPNGKLLDEIQIQPGKKTLIIQCSMDEDERLEIAAKTGKIPPQYFEKDFAVYDESRRRAYFLVETKEYRFPFGGWPGWFELKARRMKNYNEIDPNGEIITFGIPKHNGEAGSISGVFEEGFVRKVGHKQKKTTIEYI